MVQTDTEEFVDLVEWVQALETAWSKNRRIFLATARLMRIRNVPGYERIEAAIDAIDDELLADNEEVDEFDASFTDQNE